MHDLPDARGYFGKYGGQYVPETLIPALRELEEAYYSIGQDSSFKEEIDSYLKDYAGRPTPLYYAERYSKYFGNSRIYLKREDLLHTGAHKINNTIGQVLLARRMGKRKVIAETGAGQHGVATATACSLFGMDCIVFMGAKDTIRQETNVLRMKLLGAEVIPVDKGSGTLKDAINEAIRYWVTNVRDTYYCIGSVVGPHPYPLIVRNFQSVIGRETRKQIMEKEGRLPDFIVACVGGGSNSIGIFHEFTEESEVELIGVEAGGSRKNEDRNAATLKYGTPGSLHGSFSYVLQDEDGQICEAYSVSAGLDYPGVGPEHSYLKDIGRVRYETILDEEALLAFKNLSRLEGIIPALESSHALAYAEKLAGTLPEGKIIIVNLSGRGDKDLDIVLGASNGNT